ncbi:TonB-dependent siderophore receptor [Cellvibrio sp. pealriver]|uniref:TonB-dependent receptor plug domain-containing protein n=1 Tax=Cellvibrio sp. pealriver TaxID=1622269 RepID=UPI00066FFAC9|nr:TonB-dependent receptor [Cellvibrio sp. pealriver]
MRAITIKRCPLFAAVLLCSQGLLAEQGSPSTSLDDFYNLTLAELGQVEISIATGNNTPIDQAPAIATVITAGEIQAMGARNLNELLETVPGLHVALSSLSRLDSVYSIRGIHTGFNPQVLLMMNGVPVQYNVQGGRPTLFRLPVTSIERVEVIRGPGSAIYGADAYAGVINVITKDADAIEGTQIGGGVGSFNTRDLWLQTATKWNDVDVAFSMAYQESDGDDNRRVNADLQSALDYLLGTNVSKAPGSLSTRYSVLDTHLMLASEQIQFNLWNWRSADAGVGAGGAQVLDPTGRDDSNLWMGDVTYRLNPDDADAWDNSARVSYLHYDQKSSFTLFPAGTKLLIGQDGNIDFQNPVGMAVFTDGYIGKPSGVAEDVQLDLVSLYTGFESHRVRFAVGSRYQSIRPEEQKNFGPGVLDGSEIIVDGTLTDVSNTDNVFLVDSSRTVKYISLQDEWQIANELQFTAGVRHDDYSDFGTTTNPRMALVWVANDRLTTKLLYGSAFRAPSFTEQFGKNNPVVLGNPDLDPEEIDTAEISFAYSVSKELVTNITLFDYSARDMIEFVQDEFATTKTAANARDQDGSGFELEMNWKPSPRLHIASSYARQDAKDGDTGRAIPDAPGQQFKVDLNWELSSKWFVHSQLNWIGDRQRAPAVAPAVERSPIDDYALVNLTLRRKNIMPELDASLVVRNLTNEDAREPSSGEIAEDYLLESRSFWVELRYNFK